VQLILKFVDALISFACESFYMSNISSVYYCLVLTGLVEMYPAQGAGCVSEQTQNIPCWGLITTYQFSRTKYTLYTLEEWYHIRSKKVSNTGLGSFFHWMKLLIKQCSRKAAINQICGKWTQCQVAACCNIKPEKYGLQRDVLWDGKMKCCCLKRIMIEWPLRKSDHW